MGQEMHIDFAKSLAVDRNKRMKPVSDKFTLGAHMSFPVFFDTVSKMKNIAQWRARLNAVGVPITIILATKTTLEA